MPLYSAFSMSSQPWLAAHLHSTFKMERLPSGRWSGTLTVGKAGTICAGKDQVSVRSLHADATRDGFFAGEMWMFHHRQRKATCVAGIAASPSTFSPAATRLFLHSSGGWGGYLKFLTFSLPKLRYRRAPGSRCERRQALGANPGQDHPKLVTIPPLTRSVLGEEVGIAGLVAIVKRKRKHVFTPSFSPQLLLIRSKGRPE
ncbi:hypothetical protein EV126DRAFT_142287 [Verticillium dahliae]|nr:hypothetical protein EV126DRAFT_142287 [Verticillium dahliae]